MFKLRISVIRNIETHLIDYDGLRVKIKLVAWKFESETIRFDSLRTWILFRLSKWMPIIPKSLQLSSFPYCATQHSFPDMTWSGRLNPS